MKIIILDFTNNTVHVFPYSYTEFENSEDFFDTELAKEHNLKETNCQYLVSSDLTITIH